MDSYHQREQDLNRHINESLELQHELETKERYEDDPKKQVKFKKDIDALKEKISNYCSELESLVKEKREKEREALAREMPSVTFDELEVVTKFILRMQPASSEINFTLTDITEKMLKNQLTAEVHFLITMGMGKAREVGRFVEHNAILRPDFPEKLTAGFLAEYQKLWSQGITGDDLFESLRKFSSCYSSDFRKEAAGLAVLSYLFEKCEVFER